ncbi:hypothetical protein ACFFGH_06200 [Lysobacter korlensis]|uniref:Integral membrane protein n=1 Tax=Lysobacter korlensis TaxID=553636 RepID=A0ABV6RKD9_9GAMM
MRSLTVPAVLMALLVLAGCGPEPDTTTAGARLSGVLIDPQLDEVSGLATSRRHRNVLWIHDDGGNPERLFAIDLRGQRQATFRVEGVPKTDWEDLASFELDGRAYLLVADIGDNGGLRRSLQLHIIEEPSRLANARLNPAWSIAFRWPDGARDCEAVAVDVRRRQILLITKKREPPEVFSLPLRPEGGGLLTAERIGTLVGLPRPDQQMRERWPRRARLQGQVTAADISPDGRTLAVMTYRHLLLYTRAPRESWSQAIAEKPTIRALPVLPQPEALGWSRDGRTLYATGEFIPAPLYQVRP